MLLPAGWRWLAHPAQAALDAIIKTRLVGFDFCLDECEVAGYVRNPIGRVLEVLLLFASVIPGAANESSERFVSDG